MLSLILKDNSFHLTEKTISNGTAMGIKMAVAFANIFMGKTEQAILRLNTKNH